jgi:putative hydrolase of the HAD superfamily
MVKAVIFDFYNTLAETKSYGPSWEELLDELGYSLPPDIRDRWWNDGTDGTEHDEHSQSRDHYVAWQQSRVRSMLSECGVPDSAHDDLITRVREIGAHNRIEAYAEVADVIRGLRAQGTALAICSNWDWDLHEAVESAGLTGAFDVVVSSAWVGARKAHPRIYTHTLEQLGLAPEDALFVGDTWSCDVDGPRAAGMRAIYLRRAHLGHDHTAPHADLRPADVHHALDLRAVERLAQP